MTRPPWRGLAALLLVLVALHGSANVASAGTAAPAAAAAQQHGVAWVVQLSDLHINRYVHHAIVPDLLALGEAVLAPLRPGALLITGDLVDAKTPAEGSKQHVEEWQAYEHVWRHLADAAGLLPHAVLDVRGNHDAFDTLRGSGQDLFTLHSATAAAHGTDAAAERRLWAATLQPQLLLPRHLHHQHARGGGSGAEHAQAPDAGLPPQLGQAQQHHHHKPRAPGQGRRLRRAEAAGANSSSAAAARRLAAAAPGTTEPGGASCPAVVLLGIDFSPNIGLHSLANFFGVADASLMQQLQQQLEALAAEQRAACGGGAVLPPTISYSHYTFSTITGSPLPSGSGPARRQQQPAGPFTGARSAAAAAAAAGSEGGRAVARLLGAYDVAAHLSGHLHDLFGPHQFAAYAKPTAARAAAAGLLLDLEAADWKKVRRWRLVAADSGTVSLADFTFRPLAPGSAAAAAGQRYRVASVDRSRVIAQHAVLLTHPADARYSPLTVAQPAPHVLHPGSHLPVRALVAPLRLLGNTTSTGVAEARVSWSCMPRRAWRAGQRGVHARRACGSRAMHPAGLPPDAPDAGEAEGALLALQPPYELQTPQVFALRQPLTYAELAQCCTSDSGGSADAGEWVLSLQAAVRGTARGQAVSSSELRPVRVRLAPTAAGARDSGEGPLPLPSNIAERTVQSFDGPRFAKALFYGCWAAQFGALLLCRLFSRGLLSLQGHIRLAAAPGHANGGTSASKQQQQQLQRLESGSVSSMPRCRPFGSWLPLLALLLRALLLMALAALRRLLLAAASLALLPLVGLALLGQCHPGPWGLLVAHTAYALAGPWFAAQLGSASPGWGLWLPTGLLLPLPADLPRSWVSSDAAAGVDGLGPGADSSGDLAAVVAALAAGTGINARWVWLRLGDVHIVCGLSMASILLPLTVWLGMLVHAWHAAAAAAGAAPGAPGSAGRGAASGAAAASPPGRAADAAAASAPAAAGSGGPAYALADARTSSLSSRHTTGGAGGAGGTDEEWQLVPLSSCEAPQMLHQAQDGDSVGALPAASSSSSSVASNSRLMRSRSGNSPQRRRKESVELAALSPPPPSPGAGPGSAAARDSAAGGSDGCGDDAPATGGPAAAPAAAPDADSGPVVAAPPWLHSCSRGRTGSCHISFGAADDVGSVLLRGASQVLLLPVTAGLLPPSAAAAAAAAATAVPSATTSSGRLAALACCCLRSCLLSVRAVGAVLQLAAVPLPLLVLLLPVAALWCKATGRLAVTYGPPAVLLSPVLGWLPLLLLLVLRRVRREVQQQSSAAAGCCTGGKTWRQQRRE